MNNLLSLVMLILYTYFFIFFIVSFIFNYEVSFTNFLSFFVKINYWGHVIIFLIAFLWFFKNQKIKILSNRSKLLYESNPTPLISFNSSTYKLVLANRAALLIMGMQQQLVREVFLEKILDKILLDKIKLAEQNLVPLENFQAQLFALDGRSFYAIVSLSWINMGTYSRGILGFYDNTEQYEMSNKLASNAEILEKEVLRRTKEIQDNLQVLALKNAALDRAKQEADSANKSKSAFVANMSHELRTPLNAILGYSEILLEQAKGDNNLNYQADLKKIYNAGNHLLKLINDVLDFSKIEAGKITLYLEHFTLESLFADVQSVIEPLVLKNQNQFILNNFAPNVTMVSDITKVKQNLFNLLSNAAKFTKNGTITLSVVKQQNNLSFAVSDTGIGITPQQLSKLFQAFSQADDSTNRKYGGTGLGLAIAKNFTELLGGNILISSEYNKGTTFTMVLPMDSTEFVNSSKQNAQTTQQDPANIEHQAKTITPNTPEQNTSTKETQNPITNSTTADNTPKHEENTLDTTKTTKSDDKNLIIQTGAGNNNMENKPKEQPLTASQKLPQKPSDEPIVMHIVKDKLTTFIKIEHKDQKFDNNQFAHAQATGFTQDICSSEILSDHQLVNTMSSSCDHMQIMVNTTSQGSKKIRVVNNAGS